MTDHPADTRPCNHCDAGIGRVLRGGHLVHVSETTMGEESKDCGRCDECNPVENLTDDELSHLEAAVRREHETEVVTDAGDVLSIVAELRAARVLLSPRVTGRDGVRGRSPLEVAREAVADALTEDDRLRLADQPATGPVEPIELAVLETHAKSMHPMAAQIVPRVTAQFRAMRALLAELKEEGCPFDESGCCVYCDARLSDGVSDRVESHRPMEDGQPCLWVRIEQS